ncbi:MAG: biopolymer transporter ExbD [Bacteroidia bacterium]|nr:biopolymer transporter ExbD [Bacteroidia bacterium]NNC86210.1 biopolymer transporter ExbD [Bacteroidia bacterium]NNM16402.1 biopolymer transporter ExbD [Bacteroidia bacterium]
MSRKKRHRDAPAINAGSMADIAFLLLVFFLVVTTMDIDKGIVTKLPPWPENEDEVMEPDDVNRRNIYIVLVNSQDQLLVNNEYYQIEDLREGAKNFIDNNGVNPKLSDSPKDAIVSLQNDRGTSYDMYVRVQNELRASYRELRDTESMNKFGKVYAELTKAQGKEIKDKYPMRLSEAEPVDKGKR